MTQTSANRFGTEDNLLTSCELVAHPGGKFRINGKKYRPEWERAPTGENYQKFYSRIPEAVELAVKEANKVCIASYPKMVSIEYYCNGRIRIIVQE